MKRIFIAGIIFFLAMVGTAMAITYTGDLKASDGFLMAPSQWNQAVFSWEVDDSTNPGYWTYSYSWSATAKDINQLDVEVSEGFVFTGGFSSNEGITKTSDGPFSNSDLISWESSKLVNALEGPQTLNEIFGSLYGIKWELGEDSNTFELTLVSTRMPMWGDIYAKDGKSGGNDIYAKNIMFGTDTNDAADDGNHGGWALVPDTAAVPIPGAAWLLGSGLLGLVLIRKNKKNY